MLFRASTQPARNRGRTDMFYRRRTQIEYCTGRSGIKKRMKAVWAFFRAPIAALIMAGICALPALSGVKTKLDEEKWIEMGARLQGCINPWRRKLAPHQ